MFVCFSFAASKVTILLSRWRAVDGPGLSLFCMLKVRSPNVSSPTSTANRLLQLPEDLFNLHIFHPPISYSVLCSFFCSSFRKTSLKILECLQSHISQATVTSPSNYAHSRRIDSQIDFFIGGSYTITRMHISVALSCLLPISPPLWLSISASPHWRR